MDAKRENRLRAHIEAQKRGRAITRKSEKRRAAIARIDHAFKSAKPADDFLQELIKQIRGKK